MYRVIKITVLSNSDQVAGKPVTIKGMITMKFILMVVASFISFGCVTFDANEAKSLLMKEGAANSTRFIFLEGGDFGVAINGAANSVFESGLIGISEERLSLFSKDNSDQKVKKRFSIPIKEVSNVGLIKDGLGRQVQILADDFLIVFSITKGGAFVDQAATERAYSVIESMGVKAYAPEKLISPESSESFFPVLLPVK